MAAAIRRSVQFLRFNNGHRSRPLSRTAPSGCPLLGQSFEAHEYLIKARTLLAKLYDHFLDVHLLVSLSMNVEVAQ